MTLYLFRHTADAAILGVADEPSGGKLPAVDRFKATLPLSRGEWTFFGKYAEINQISLAFTGFSEAEAKAAIEREGYYVHHPQINLSVTYPPK